MLTTSDVLGGRYRLDGPVAAGGMGEVWRATDTVLGRTVAVKVMRAVPAFAARFRAEARTLATVHHPGIVEVYDYGEVGGEAYLVMAFVHGEPLSHRLAAAGRLGADETMSVVAQVARALSAAHAAGVVHRDVKPANLIIGDEGRVVLVDFGVAYTEGTAALTGAREVMGTARYMAPEQVTKQPASPATDVYALGAVAYECLAGRPPFVAESAIAVAIAHLDQMPEPLPPDVPPAVRDVVTTALAKDPADRFRSAAAMADAAEAARAGGPRSGSTRQFAAVPPLDATAPIRGAAPVGVAAPVAFRPDYPATDDYPAAYPATGRRSPAGRRLALIAALLVVLIGVGVVLLALADSGSPGGPAPSPPSTSASHQRSGKPSPSRKTPSASAKTSTSTGPSASVTPTTTPTPSPTPTTAPPTTTPPTTEPPTTSPPTGTGASG